MADKADFNAEEWSQLRQGPPIAGLLVMQADRGGTVRESLEMTRFYTETRQLWADTGGEPQGLVEHIIADGPEVDPRRFSAGEAEQGLDALRDAVAVLGRHAGPEETEDYRRFILTLAQRVAEAHKEGGFLGIGGRLVSDAEQAMLDRVAEAIGG